MKASTTSAFYAAVVAATLALSAVPSQALPNGSPSCAVSEAKLTAGMGPSKGDLGFALQVQGDGLMMLTNSKGRTSFKGIMLYVAESKDAMHHCGKFTIPMNQGLKANTQVCSKAMKTGDAAAVITHSNPDMKPLSTKFWWKNTAKDSMCKDNSKLHVYGIVVGEGKPDWQILKPVPLMNMMNSTTSSVSSSTKMRRCRRIPTNGNTVAAAAGSSAPAVAAAAGSSAPVVAAVSSSAMTTMTPTPSTMMSSSTPMSKMMNNVSSSAMTTMMPTSSAMMSSSTPMSKMMSSSSSSMMSTPSPMAQEASSYKHSSSYDKYM